MHRAALVTLALCCSASAQQLQLAITFDDLPGQGERPASVSRLEIAQSVLDTLRRERLPPVYGFLNAAKVQQETGMEPALKAWRDAGQPLGNHTWSHPDLNRVSTNEFEAEILKDEPMLARYMAGQDWHWFRYPFLAEGDTLERRRSIRGFLNQHGYQIAEVSMDFEDYLWNAPYARCLAKHDDAAIRRLHDSYLTAADHSIDAARAITKAVYGRDIRYVLLMHLGAFDARMLPELLALYRRCGFNFISLPEAIADPAYAQDPDVASKYGAPIEQLMLAKRGMPWPRHAIIPPTPTQELQDTCK